MSKIIGNITTTPVPRSDWSQTDKKKADYIRNKPDLDEKVDKVVGTEGNAVIFGANGAIVDSGKILHNIHIIPYYEQSTLDASDVVTKLVADVIAAIRDDENAGNDYAVYIRQSGNLLPAQSTVTGRIRTFTTIYHDNDTYQYKITATVTAATVSNVTTSKELFFVEDVAANPTSNKAPSAKAVVDYVANNAPASSSKAYVFIYDTSGASDAANLATYNEFLADYAANDKANANVMIYNPTNTVYYPTNSRSTTTGWYFSAYDLYNYIIYNVQCHTTASTGNTVVVCSYDNTPLNTIVNAVLEALPAAEEAIF